MKCQENIFLILLALVFMNQHFAETKTIFILKNEPTEDQVVNALKSFCVGKSTNFCSDQHLKLSMDILREKERLKLQDMKVKAVKENAFKNKIEMTNILERKQQFKKQMEKSKEKILKDLREHFLIRYW